MGLLDRLKQRLSKTREKLSDGISALFRGGRPIDDQLLGELEELLYTADLGPIATELVEDLARMHKRGELKGEEDVREHLRSTLLARLDQAGGEYDPPADPTVILIVGVNGSGRDDIIGFGYHDVFVASSNGTTALSPSTR